MAAHLCPDRAGGRPRCVHGAREGSGLAHSRRLDRTERAGDRFLRDDGATGELEITAEAMALICVNRRRVVRLAKRYRAEQANTGAAAPRPVKSREPTGFECCIEKHESISLNSAGGKSDG